MKLISHSIPRSALLSLFEFSSCSVSIVASLLVRWRLANEHATAKIWKRTLHGISSDLELTLSLFDNNSHTLQTVSISTCDYTSLATTMWIMLTGLCSSDWVHDKFDNDRCMWFLVICPGISLTAMLFSPPVPWRPQRPRWTWFRSVWSLPSNQPWLDGLPDQSADWVIRSSTLTKVRVDNLHYDITETDLEVRFK
jgi:hypothetical protein